MPWRCPACQTQIRHNEFEDSPTPGRIYRCHICRLELSVDHRSGRLTVAPLLGGEDEKERPTR